LIPGFDLDNSPLAYTSGVVRGRTVVFTTTNGTRALRRSHHAAQILLGGFTNRRALVARLMVETRPIHFVCAGTDGRLTAEDALLAGTIALDLLESRTGHTTVAPAARGTRTQGVHAPSEMTLAWARGFRPLDDERLLSRLRDSEGGRNLIELGFDADIAYAARQSRTSTIPELNPLTGEIRPMTT
jgi:2-phosphosulfolactate phosphatase